MRISERFDYEKMDILDGGHVIGSKQGKCWWFAVLYALSNLGYTQLYWTGGGWIGVKDYLDGAIDLTVKSLYNAVDEDGRHEGFLDLNKRVHRDLVEKLYSMFPQVDFYVYKYWKELTICASRTDINGIIKDKARIFQQSDENGLGYHFVTVINPSQAMLDWESEKISREYSQALKNHYDFLSSKGKELFDEKYNLDMSILNDKLLNQENVEEQYRIMEEIINNVTDQEKIIKSFVSFSSARIEEETKELLQDYDVKEQERILNESAAIQLEKETNELLQENDVKEQERILNELAAIKLDKEKYNILCGLSDEDKRANGLV